jgi:hypothetical protein
MCSLTEVEDRKYGRGNKGDRGDKGDGRQRRQGRVRIFATSMQIK